MKKTYTNHNEKIVNFYSRDLEKIEKIKTFAAYTKTPISHILNDAVEKWYDEHEEDVLEAIKIQEDIDIMIESYKKKL